MNAIVQDNEALEAQIGVIVGQMYTAIDELQRSAALLTNSIGGFDGNLIELKARFEGAVKVVNRAQTAFDQIDIDVADLLEQFGGDEDDSNPDAT
jgi:hypothetical protein